MEPSERLAIVARELQDGGSMAPVTVREFLSWFHSLRRGRWIVEWIRAELERAGLTTVPDFESLYIDAGFTFELVPTALGEPPSATSAGEEAVEQSIFDDPTYRLTKLAAANRPPLTVPPTATIREAVTQMIANDYSQLPVATSDRDIKGVISWASLGSRMALGVSVTQVREAMDSYVEIAAHDSLFQAIPIIVSHGYVLVRAEDRRVVGIVTASDLSLQFQQLTEPFLLIGEIENHIRRLLDRKFSLDELSACRSESDATRSIGRVSDLTFGEYLRLIENPIKWIKVGLPIDRDAFCKQLERVRVIRNDVMHFDPDGIPPEDIEHLRKVARFLKRMQDMGVS
jgi:CBS domain-containing protein